MNLTQFRKENPAYDDMSDRDLAVSLHQKYYSDVPQEEFFGEIGFKPVTATESFARGVVDPVESGAQLLERGVRSIPIVGPGAVDAVNALNNFLADYGVVARVGAGGVAEDIAARERAYQSRLGNEGIDWWRMGGNVLGSAPLAFGAAPASLVGRAALGATEGVLSAPVGTTDDFWTEKALQAGLGGVFGAALPAIGSRITRATQRIATPEELADQAAKAAHAADVQKLRKMGIEPTIGQMLGGGAARAEQSAMSIPGIGELIGSRRREALEQFNRGALQQAGEIIGEPVGEKIGHAGTAELNAAITRGYNELFDAIPEVQLLTDSTTFKTQAEKSLTGDRLQRAKKIARLLDDVQTVAKKQGLPPETISGRQLKTLDSELSNIAAQYSKGTGNDLELAKLVKDLRNDLKLGIPEPFNDKLLRLDLAYATSKITGEAAKGDVFTPAQLAKTAFEMAKKRGYGNRAIEGTGLLQPYAATAENVLGSKVPDSGTAGRGLLSALLLGQLDPTGFITPTGGALAALYSRKGQKFARSFLEPRAPRPQSALDQYFDAVTRDMSFAPALTPALTGETYRNIEE